MKGINHAFKLITGKNFRRLVESTAGAFAEKFKTDAETGQNEIVFEVIREGIMS